MDNLNHETKAVAEGAVPRTQAAGWRNGKLWLFVFVGTLVVVFGVYNLSELIRLNRENLRFSPQQTLSLEEPETPLDGESSSAANALRVAIAPVISPKKSLPLYKGLVDYLAGKLGKESEPLQGGTYEEVNQLVRDGGCDLAMVCTYAYVLGEKQFKMKALVVPQIDDEIHYHSLILVPKSSQAASLLDLRGKHFASANRLSNSGWLFPMVWLRRHNEDANTFFGPHEITGSHDRSVEKVAEEEVDGAAVDSLVYDQMVEERPSIGSKTKVILESPEYGMPPLVVPPGIDPALEQQLLTILLQMHEDAEGRKVLESLGIQQFREPPGDLFDSVRVNAEFWEQQP